MVPPYTSLGGMKLAQVCCHHAFSCRQAHYGGMPDRDLCVALGRTGDRLAVAAAHLTHGSVCPWVQAIDLARLSAAKESGSIGIIAGREGAVGIA